MVRPNCFKCRPSTSSAPTTTAEAPNRAFGLPPGIPHGCCVRPHTSRSSPFAHRCSAEWCASHTPPAPYPRVGRPTADSAPAKAHASSPSDTLRGRGYGTPRAWPRRPGSKPTSRFRTGGRTARSPCRTWRLLVGAHSPVATPARPVPTSRAPCRAGSARLGCRRCHPARASGRGTGVMGGGRTIPSPCNLTPRDSGGREGGRERRRSSD